MDTSSCVPAFGMDTLRRRHLLTNHLLVVALCLLCLLTVDVRSWRVEHEPRSRIDLLGADASPNSGVKTFWTQNTDHYRILHVDTNTDSLIIGARNMVFNISVKSTRLLKINKKIEWMSDGNVINVCKSRGNSEEDCQNYIRVIINKTEDGLFICGTNAFKPACRVYKNFPDYYEQQQQEPGVAKCPFDPRQNSTYLFTDGQLYSGTVADINVRDPLIYRAPMRTEQYDSQVLNDPDFVNSYDYGDNVYFFFREFAVEYINCGKAVYSRVARICKKDRGGHTVLRHVWTSFFKSRLNCSIPGDFPFYFDEIQSTTDLGRGHFKPISDISNRTDMIYGVFNTPENSISGSAVCAFKMSDVIATFEGGFKEQKSAHFTWLPVNEGDMPKPHPATCNNNSEEIPIQTLNFIKSHPLMDMAVPTFGARPILVQTSLTSRMTQIAVDWQRPTIDGKYYDVLFIGTSDGTVIKAINKGLDNIDSVIIEEIRVFEQNTPVTGLRVHRSLISDEEPMLIVLSKSAIKTVPLHRCSLKTSCSACVGLRDPYCSWDNKKCRPNTLNGIQNIDDGTGCTGPDLGGSRDSNVIASASASAPTSPPCVCPEQRAPIKPTVDIVHQAAPTTTAAGSRDDNLINIGEENPVANNNHINILPEGRILKHKDPEVGASTQVRGDTVNASTLAISLVFSILIALCVGFLAGYRTSLYRHKSHSDDLFMSSSKTHTHKNLNRFDDPNHYNTHDYTPQPRSEKQLNVVFNPLKPNTKLPNGSAETKVQQKVKKVYL